MAIKDIFTLVDLYDENLSAARVAFDLARRTDAHVTGLALALEPLAPGYLASPIPADFVIGAVAEAQRQSRDAADRFAALAGEAGVAAEARTVTLLAGATTHVLAQAQLSDLVVIGQENYDRPEPMRAAIIEAVLFEAAVPLLMVPQGWNRGLAPGKAIVAWDGSPTAARAVHAALPLLERAEGVEITIVGTTRLVSGEPGVDVARYLARHGIAVEVNTMNRDTGDAAAALNTRVRELGAELLVMGAYGHSRLREFVVGGATRDMLEGMIVPTVMQH
jgi:nucleotide-binding universal stress UspA family protein